MYCVLHPEVASSGTCVGCAEPFCDRCLVAIKGTKYCGGCKTLAVGKDAIYKVGPTGTCEEAGSALKIALCSILCGIIVGPIALVKALNARKILSDNPGLEGSGKATAALIISVFTTLMNVMGLIAKVVAAGGRA